jgi:Obg family GTPase CgtA-like protein
MHKIPLNTPDNVVRFNQKIANSNAEKIAKKHGAISGDTMVINGVEFLID